MEQMAKVPAVNFKVRRSCFIGAPLVLTIRIRGNGGVYILREMGNDHKACVRQGRGRETCGVRESTDAGLYEVIAEESIGICSELS